MSNFGFKNNKESNPTYSKAKREKALRIYQDKGCTAAHKETGLSMSYISKMASRRGINYGGRILDRSQINKLIALRKKGYTYAELANEFDMSEGSARNYVKAFVEGEDIGFYKKSSLQKFPTIDEYHETD